jgi:hypothetical protein
MSLAPWVIGGDEECFRTEESKRISNARQAFLCVLSGRSQRSLRLKAFYRTVRERRFRIPKGTLAKTLDRAIPRGKPSSAFSAAVLSDLCD